MSRPLTRSSGKFGRNTRHSSKKSPHLLKNKNHVVTNLRGSPQIRKSISRKYIHELNLATSRSKRALSVPSSKGKRPSYELNGVIDVPKPFRYRLRSQSECILETPIHQFRKKSMLIKQTQDELPLNKRNTITEFEQSTPTDFKRLTRSSMGNRDDRNFMGNRRHETMLVVSPLPKTTVKQIKCKTLGVKSNVLKRMMCSSVDKVASNTFLKSRSSEDKLITLHRSKKTLVKCKKSFKEANIISENPKRSGLLCSIESAIVSSSLKGSLKDNIVTPSVLKNAVSPVNSRRVTPSNFRIITDFTPLIKKMSKSKILVSPCSLSAPVAITRKKSEKEVVQKDSERMKSCNLNDASLYSTKFESGKQPQETRDTSPVSVNRRKSVRSTSVNLLHNTRLTDSGSLPARELPKRNCKRSTGSKGQERKSAVSPQRDKTKKNAALKTSVADEDCIPLDSLTIESPDQRPRRHTVNVCIKNKKASNLSVIQQKAKKTYTTKTKTKLSKPRKGNKALPHEKSPSAPDMSQLTIDCIATFGSATKSSKKRPKSAPAAIKRKSKVAGLQTPIPKKGTLKRKRWMVNALKEKNEGYEDDIFENQKFRTPAFRIFNEEEDESDSSIKTPKFGFLLTPSLPKITPTFKETISSADLLLARKNAEEYLYRRNKKRTNGYSTLNSPSQASVVHPEVPEKKKLEFTEVLAKVETIRKDLEEKMEDESDEDDYFTDVNC